MPISLTLSLFIQLKAIAPKLASTFHLVNRKLTNDLPYKISSIYLMFGPTVKATNNVWVYSRI